MTSTPNLDHYFDSLDNLPVELQRNFTLMRDLDSRVEELMSNIDKKASDYMSNVKGYSVKKKNETMTSIQSQFDKAKEYSDDKVQLAIQTYELVDKRIRKLDSDLARFEAGIQDRAIGTTRNIEEGSQKLSEGGKNTKDKEVKKKSESSEEETVTETSKKKQLKKVGPKSTSAAPSKTPLVSTDPTNPTNSVASVTVETSSLTGARVAHTAEVLDMPVDPNEPTYCLCDQVSFGSMIGCDNPDCPIEWFHFECVKLITKPKGKWFCPKCVTDRKKK